MMQNKKILVLDPGHGGRDSGAYNAEVDIEEKTINLAVALYARRYIQKNDIAILPVLTRKRDLFPTLQERCDISNNVDADAFVSIHCNSREFVGCHGIEVEIFHCPGSIYGKMLAKAVLEQYLHVLDHLVLGTDLKIYNRGIKVEKFHVLLHTTAPAVLLELGMLCDSEEAEFLSKKHNQRLISASIVQGVVEYFAI